MTKHTLRVLELYKAYQGEGKLIGQPTTFVRFSGCTVGCYWCDTKYSWRFSRGTDYTSTDLLDLVHTLNVPSVVFTGGEPFEQDRTALADLFSSLSAAYLDQATVETSAVFAPVSALESVRVPTLLSLAPKLPSAATNYEFPDLLPWIELVSAHRLLSMQLKFVIDPQSPSFDDDLDHIDVTLRNHRSDILALDIPVIFTPVTHYSRDPRKVRDQIADDLERLHTNLQEVGWDTWLPNFRVLPQLHAMIYGSKKGI